MSIFRRDSFCGRAVALAMGALLAISSPAQALAQAKAANTGKYISDVRVGVGKTDKEAVGYLEGEGYTVMGYLGDHAREGAKGDYARLADLNEGADAWLKSTRKVFLGYKTTDNAAEAVTDLAVMGMDGGYSFSSYAQLMDKYREETVRPLQEQVMRMVAEYRANAESDDPGRQARAEVARASLNMVTDDDTGERMGDLLLKETSQEMGATPSTMGEGEASAWREANPGVLDLECALMQGNSDVVANIELILASATDDTGTTWLQRLSDLGPEGLEERFADLPPTDARNEMDSLYQDAAVKLAEGWADLAAELDGAHGRIGADYEGEDETVGGVDDGEGATDLDEPEALGGDDEGVDPELLEDLYVDIEEPEVSEVSPEDAPQIISDMADEERAALEVADVAQEASMDVLYHTLRSLPWGDGTLYDYFSMGEAEAARDGAYALYPIIAVLTDGQVASIDFQSVSSLARQGATSATAFEAMTDPDANILEATCGKNEVSLYQGVRREIFSDLSALTSEAMRKDALNAQGAGGYDILSRHKVSLFFLSLAAVAGIVTIASPVIKASARQLQVLQIKKNVLNEINNMIESTTQGTKLNLAKFEVMEVMNIDGPANGGPVTVKLTFTDGRFDEVCETLDFTYSGLNDKMKSLEDVENSVKKTEKACKPKWSFMKKAFCVAAVVMALVSLASAVYEIYDYFNVDYTPIPKYMVDERDVTEVADDGTVRVVRNDAAYYEVARTNRKSDADHYDALRDFADLNGDGGKGWVALYVGRDPTLQPILADSLKAVVGTATVPDGYATGIHDFGSEGAANLTDMRYSYNDSAGGIYAYFAREVPEGAAAETASAFGGGSASPVAFAVIGLAAGAAAGSAVTYAVLKRRKEQ